MSRRKKSGGSGIRTASDLKRATAAAGNNFFSTDTMRWWRSRIEAVYETSQGAVYVTSEQMDDTTPRRYTVGVWDGRHTKTHEVKQPIGKRGGPPVVVPGFQAFAKPESAKRYAAALARRLR